MVYFIIMIIGILLYQGKTVKLTSIGDRPKTDKRLLFMGCLLFLVGALRHPSVGSDTYTYIGHFERTINSSWIQILRSKEEPGYFLLCKFISIFSRNPQWILVLVSLIYTLSVVNFLKNNSQNPEISIIVLIAFQFFAFSITGLRQTLAIAVVLFSFNFIKQRKFIPFFLFVILAYFFHNSAILAFPVYFLFGIENKQRNKKQLRQKVRTIFLFSLPVIYFLRRIIISYLLQYFYSEYEIYDVETNAWTTFFLYFIIWIMHVLFGGEFDGFEIMLMFGIIIQLFVPLEPTIFRLAMYYQISILIILPKLISKMPYKNSTGLAYSCCIVIMLIIYFGFTYYAAGANPYRFFWK